MRYNAHSHHCDGGQLDLRELHVLNEGWRDERETVDVPRA